MSSIEKKLKVLQELAKENSSMVNNSCKVLQQYIDNGKETLDDIDNGKDFFTAISFLNAQQKAPKIEQFIRKKLHHDSVLAKWNQGDGKKDGKYYEYKISTTNEEEQINALQIRLQQEIDYYLLGYIDEKQFEYSRLYLVPKSNIEFLCDKYKESTHGTNSNMKSLRIKMKTDNERLSYLEKNFRARDLEKIIFNL